MRILVVLKQKKNVDTFLDTIRALLVRGHDVTLALQERTDDRMDEYTDALASTLLKVAHCPPPRIDAWSEAAPLLRSLRDCLHYQRPELRDAQKLQVRAIDKLREDLYVAPTNEEAATVLRELPAAQIAALDAVLALAEQQLPTDSLHDEFLSVHRPDVLLVSPLVHFGSAQADLVASARRSGVPVGMLLFSWDNLSTKGRMHQAPDWMFVWNERQRREASALHGFPEERVVVVGAPRFDGFFALEPRLTREEFLSPLGLDPAKPTLLYVCSSPFVSAGERAFVQKWLRALRMAEDAALREVNVLVRPHPDIALLDLDEPTDERRWPARPGMKAIIARPFDDDRAIVLRTSDRAQKGLFECIRHSAAVVGLNTSAELESAIVGRPVYTVLVDDDDADGQQGTLHFHYLTEKQGGFVRVAGSLTEHLAQLSAELRSPTDSAVLREFVGEFLRPMGIDKPVAPQLAEAIERTCSRTPELTKGTTATVVSSREVIEAVHPVPSTVKSLPGVDIQMTLSPSHAGDRLRIDKVLLGWLKQHVRGGDVLYDTTAGTGLYTVLAVKQRGAIVVAFEPGFTAFKLLCDNIRRNGCDGSVVSVPLALGDSDGPGELKFPQDQPGEERHALRPMAWRRSRGGREGRSDRQTVCVTSLDIAQHRYQWPRPNHLRLADPASVALVLGGARELLASESLRSIFLTAWADDVSGLLATLEDAGWPDAVPRPISRGRVHVVLSRAGAAS